METKEMTEQLLRVQAEIDTYDLSPFIEMITYNDTPEVFSRRLAHVGATLGLLVSITRGSNLNYLNTDDLCEDFYTLYELEKVFNQMMFPGSMTDIERYDVQLKPVDKTHRDFVQRTQSESKRKLFDDLTQYYKRNNV